MDIVVNEELRAYIDPLTPEDYESLERSILAEGCTAMPWCCTWGDVLVGLGHNRYGIYQGSTAFLSRPCRTRASSRWRTCTCG